jgi:glycosyltransferase involved in cell wall biosynthesis
MNLKIINTGSFVIDDRGEIRHLKNYAHLYNNLINQFDEVAVFSGYITEHETGAAFLNDIAISNKLRLVLAKGNNPNTNSFMVIMNYLFLSLKLFPFCLGKNNYFIFMPSPIGLISFIYLFLFNNKSNIGLYIGGNYNQEHAYSKRYGYLRRLFTKPLGMLINHIQHKAILKANYVLTTCYDLYYHFHNLRPNLHLASPLINVDEDKIANRAQKKSDKIIITYCGELRKQKGCLDLLQAFKIIIANNLYHRSEKLSLRYVGDGECRRDLMSIVEACGFLSNKVEFTGHIKEKETLLNILRESALFVLPSYSEGFPRVAYEQFILGVPTILSPVGGIPFLLKNNRESLFVKPGDIQDIINKILIMLSNKRLKRNIIYFAKILMYENIFPKIKHNGTLESQIVKLIKCNDQSV